MWHFGCALPYILPCYAKLTVSGEVQSFSKHHQESTREKQWTKYKHQFN